MYTCTSLKAYWKITIQTARVFSFDGLSVETLFGLKFVIRANLNNSRRLWNNGN